LGENIKYYKKSLLDIMYQYIFTSKEDGPARRSAARTVYTFITRIEENITIQRCIINPSKMGQSSNTLEGL
jgi:hypothetical protein